MIELAADLYDAGYTNITCIDISTVAINLMGDLYSEKEEMECKPYYHHHTTRSPSSSFLTSFSNDNSHSNGC